MQVAQPPALFPASLSLPIVLVPDGHPSQATFGAIVTRCVSLSTPSQECSQQSCASAHPAFDPPKPESLEKSHEVPDADVRLRL